jgi:hypothetical protein
MNQGRWKEAEELQVQVLETSKRVLTDEHPDTLISMHNLASTLQSQARHEEAHARWKDASSCVSRFLAGNTLMHHYRLTYN